MRKIFLLFVIVCVLSASASAQFSFTDNSGKKFSVSSAPQKTDLRGGGFVMEFYYAVEGSDLVVYEVGKTKGVVGNSIAVTKVKIDTIKPDRFKARKFDFGCYMQTGTPFTKITHGSDYAANDTYSNDNLQLDFKDCDAANEFRTAVLGEDLGLDELDLDLEDKPKKEESKMPAHLFALIGTADRGTYQFNRRNMEVWDYKTNNVFKVGKIVEVGSELRMLVADESYFTYNVKDGKLFNGNKFLGIELVNDVICKSYNGEKCFSRFQIDRDDSYVYSVFDKGNTTRYERYKIKGEATNEEILLIFALLEKL